MSTIQTVPCKRCGVQTEGRVVFINHEGPFCGPCAEIEMFAPMTDHIPETSKMVPDPIAAAFARLEEWKKANPECACYVNDECSRPAEFKFLVDLYDRNSPKLASGFGPTEHAAVDAALKAWEEKNG